MTVWPFRPQMGDEGLIESLQWLTDITRCYTAEYRQCLRTLPRMRWQHRYLLDSQAYATAVELCRSNSASSIDVPEWNSLSSVPATNAGTVTLPVSTGIVPGYKLGGSVIIWETDLLYEVCTISGVASSSISISATTVNHGAATIAPLRSCTFTTLLEADREAVASCMRANAAFETYLTEDLTPDFGAGIAYATYLGVPVVTDRIELLGGAKDSVEREVSSLDSQTGVLYTHANYSTPTRASVLAWYCATANDVWNLRRWLHSRKGRQKNFWAPSWNADVVVTHDIAGGDTSIEIAAVGFATKWTVPCDLAIFAPDGGFWPVRVTGAVAGGAGKELLTLSEAFDGSVSLANILVTCKLTLSRIDTDTVEINHLPGGQATVAVSIAEDPNTP